ncbi:MAG: ATP-grasp domain-containing protein [Clostridia bacterium]|nr:ATP-grasp domain-containing protein [Clostridia bacterium]
MKKALVLCATVPHTLLIEKLKARGYYVLLADMNPNAPAVPFADEFLCVSAFDKDAIVAAAKENAVDLVISSCSEQANSVCCYVGETLGLPHPYSYETSLDVTNKGRMKRLFKKGGVTTSDYMLFDSVEQLRGCSLPFPLVVKPVDAYSSKGVHKAETPEALIEFGKDALRVSRSGHGIVEGYCPGVEIQVDCVAIGGKAQVLMTRSKRTLSQDAIELNSGGSIVPAEMTAAEDAQAAVLAQRIADAFGLVNTPFFYQARLHDGVISVLEFAPRIGGGLSFQMVKRATGIDIVDLSIQSFLGEALSTAAGFDRPKPLATLLLYMEPGVFGEVAGLDALLANGTVDYSAVLKKRGDAVDANRTSSNRAATLLMTADSREALEEKIQTVLKTIDILDVNGVSRMAR